MIYNSVFFYHQLNTRSIVRYDLVNKTSAALDIEDVTFGKSSRYDSQLALDRSLQEWCGAQGAIGFSSIACRFLQLSAGLSQRLI